MLLGQRLRYRIRRCVHIAVLGIAAYDKDDDGEDGYEELGE